MKSPPRLLKQVRQVRRIQLARVRYLSHSPVSLDNIDTETREFAIENLELILGPDREQIKRFVARAAARRSESP